MYISRPTWNKNEDTHFCQIQYVHFKAYLKQTFKCAQCSTDVYNVHVSFHSTSWWFIGLLGVISVWTICTRVNYLNVTDLQIHFLDKTWKSVCSPSVNELFSTRWIQMNNKHSFQQLRIKVKGASSEIFGEWIFLNLQIWSLFKPIHHQRWKIPNMYFFWK